MYKSKVTYASEKPSRLVSVIIKTDMAFLAAPKKIFCAEVARN